MIENFNYIAIASVSIPFLVQILKHVLTRLKVKVKAQTLVLIICVSLGAVYSAVVSFVPTDAIALMAKLAGITFVTSQALYKLHNGNKKTKTSKT